MIYAYPCQLTPDEDGSLVATFPDVPEASYRRKTPFRGLGDGRGRVSYGVGGIRP